MSLVLLTCRSLVCIGSGSWAKTVSSTSFWWTILGSVVAVVQSLSCVQIFVTPWTKACQAPLSSAVSQSLLKFMSIESVMLCNHLILFWSLLLLPLFFSQHNGLFKWVDSLHQLTKVLGLQLHSALVLPVNIQGWFPLGMTGLISSQSKGLARVFSSTTVQKPQFFGAQLSLWSNSHICTCSLAYLPENSGPWAEWGVLAVPHQLKAFVLDETVLQGTGRALCLHHWGSSLSGLQTCSSSSFCKPVTGLLRVSAELLVSEFPVITTCHTSPHSAIGVFKSLKLFSSFCLYYSHLFLPSSTIGR